MLVPTDPARVEIAFKATGSGWILEMGPSGPLLEQVALEIDQFLEEYSHRFGEVPDPFTLVDQNSDKAAAFFELYTGPPVSMDIRLAVWRLIQGEEIHSVRFAYDRGGKAELVIILGNRRRQDRQEFKGTSLGDFEVLKHIGMLTVSGQELLDGYYASSLPE